LEGSGIGNLVASLAALTESASPAEFAVIGGLAVLARLEGAHRVTDDLDTVATQHGDEPTVVEAVIAAQGVDGLLKGTKVDCIAVGDVPASLVAMKLQSAPRRRGARADKAGSDYLDLFRLVSHPAMTRSIAISLRAAPHDLGSWCSLEITRRMIEDADRTVGLIARSGVAESNVLTAAQFRRAAELLIDWIHRAP
jgi:hypothetical protein